jgi:hypothetical protein
MKIEDIKIEDTADANYVIRKFFNNDLSNIKMTQLEQLLLTVYSMGKNNSVSTDCAPDEIEPDPTEEVPVKENPFKINDKVKVLEDVEIGNSGEFIKTNDIGTVNFIEGDNLTVLFEAGEDGEMIEVSVLFDKLELVN